MFDLFTCNYSVVARLLGITLDFTILLLMHSAFRSTHFVDASRASLHAALLRRLMITTQCRSLLPNCFRTSLDLTLLLPLMRRTQRSSFPPNCFRTSLDLGVISPSILLIWV